MSLLAYFLLTFLITWAVWFAAAALAAPGNSGFFGIRGPVFLLRSDSRTAQLDRL